MYTSTGSTSLVGRLLLLYDACVLAVVSFNSENVGWIFHILDIFNILCSRGDIDIDRNNNIQYSKHIQYTIYREGII